MIAIKCEVPNKLKLGALTPFQGDLKRRTNKHIDSLAKSIIEDGLLMPFVVWKHDDKNLLLDGHGRLEALLKLATNDEDLAKQDYPVIYIEADTEEKAKQALLQITSAYGTITEKGAKSFCAALPEYHAPSINKFVYRKPVERKPESRDCEHIIRIAVKEDKYEAVRELFKTIDYIRVL